MREAQEAASGPDPRIRFLVGHWRGQGIAEFPTIDRVEYSEVLSVEWDSERGVLRYEQWATLADGTPSHRETGFIEFTDDGSVELWNAQDNGRTEVLRGPSRIDDATGNLEIELESVAFGNDSRMLGSKRRITVSPDRLSYQLSMSTTTVPDELPLPHLSADLVRVP